MVRSLKCQSGYQRRQKGGPVRIAEIPPKEVVVLNNDVVLTAGTPVLSSIRKPGVYGGVWTHADEASRWRRNAARFRHLDEMARRLRKLEKRVDELTGDKE